MADETATDKATTPETVRELLDMFRSRVTITEKQIKKASPTEKEALKMQAEVWRQARNATQEVYLQRLKRVSDSREGTYISLPRQSQPFPPAQIGDVEPGELVSANGYEWQVEAVTREQVFLRPLKEIDQ